MKIVLHKTNIKFPLIFIQILILLSACEEKEKKNNVSTKKDVVKKVTTVSDTIKSVPKSIVTELNVNDFSNKLTYSEKKESGVFLPITRAIEYTSLSERYYAFFSEDNIFKENQEYTNSRMNFYILKKLNNNTNPKPEDLRFKLEHKISENNSIFNTFNKDNRSYKFLNEYCTFKDLDQDGSIDPIVVTQGKDYDGVKTNIYIFQGGKMIPLIKYSEIGFDPFYIAPDFYLLSTAIQDYIKTIIKKLDIIDLDTLENIWNNKTCYWRDYETIEPYKEQKINRTKIPIDLPKNISYSINELKNEYEYTFPISKDISIDFPISPLIDDHSGIIENNLNSPIILPNYQLDYIYVSEKNTIFKKQIYKNEFEIFDSKEQGLIDDTSIFYDAYNGGYLVRNWEYQNGWDTEKTPLFPKDMPEGRYVAYIKLSYFDGEQEVNLFSEKEILDYFLPENFAKNENLSALKTKYEALYPTSKDLEVDTGIKLYRRDNYDFNDYYYMPHIKNTSNRTIDTKNATFTFYFIDEHETTYIRQNLNAFSNIIDTGESDILGDNNLINIVDDIWAFDNLLIDGLFPQNMPKGNYLMYSELTSSLGTSYYSKKEFIEYMQPSFKSQKMDSLYQTQQDFYKEVAKYIPENENFPNSVINCYEETIEEDIIKTCYYPKQINNKQLYAILRGSHVSLKEDLVNILPEKDTTYFSKYYHKITFKLPKKANDTLNIRIDYTDYYFYKKNDFPVLVEQYSLK